MSKKKKSTDYQKAPLIESRTMRFVYYCTHKKIKKKWYCHLFKKNSTPS